MRLGRLLGFEADKGRTQGVPDAWWIVDDGLCFVFEDHSDAQSGSKLSVRKARQVLSHPNWVEANLPLSKPATIVPVLVSPVQSADTDALPHLNGVYLWNIDEFRKWAEKALSIVRELRRTFPGSGDLGWRDVARQGYIDNNMSSESIQNFLRDRVAAEALKA